MVPARRSARTSEMKATTNGVVPNAAVATAPATHDELGLSVERLHEMFETMLLARAVDERQWILNRQGREAFHISCQGHEGSGVGSAFALDRDRDVMVPYYRSLAAVIAFDRLGPTADTDGSLTLATAAALGTALIFWTGNVAHPDYRALIGSIILGGPIGFTVGAILWWTAKRLIVRPTR